MVSLHALLLAFGLAAAEPADDAHGSDVSCVTCHTDAHAGAVGDACDSCHTSEAWSPTLFDLTRHADTAFPLKGKHVSLSCAGCHPDGKLSDLPLECAGCHVDRHRGKLGEACTDCHSVDGFLPVEGFVHLERTGFALAGVHGDAACEACHGGDNGRAMRLTMEPGCATCHTASHADFGGRTCDSCHQLDQGSFAAAAKRFDHRPTGFELERRHRAVPCASCHPASGAAAIPRCTSCHDDVHNGQAGRVCGDCHRPDRWSLVRFDHNLALWPLRGKHFVTPCLDCHRNQQWIGLRTDCVDCHFTEALQGPASIPAHSGAPSECTDCHLSLWSWQIPLTGIQLEPLDPLTFGPDQQCFGCGPTNHAGMQLRFFRDGDEVVTTFEARPGWEGAPGVVHGGLQATLADEIGAWTLIGLKGRFGFTSSLNLRYLRPARAGQPIEARGAIVDDLGSRVKVRITLSQGGDKLVAGTATYVMPTKAMAEKILAAPLPEAWLHLARPEEPDAS